MLYKYLLYLLNINTLPTAILGQSVGIGMTIPAASAALDVNSRAQSVLLPHLSQGQQPALGAGSLMEMDGDDTSLVDDSNSGGSGTAFAQARVPNAGALADTVVLASNGNVGGNAQMPAASAFKYVSAKVRALYSFAAAFQPRMKATKKLASAYRTCYSGGVSGVFEALVRLPQGATQVE